jgi:hypothetical protein
MSARGARRGGALLAAALAALGAPATAPGQAPPATPPGASPEETRLAALDAAQAWRGTLEAFRAPGLPTPGDTESVVLLLDGPPAVAADPGDRRAAAAAVRADQDALVPVLEDLGATVTFRYRVLVNAIGVRLPAGRLEALAALPEVTAVVPVAFLAPAQAAGDPAAPGPAAPRAGGRRPATPLGASPDGPAHIALIDAGVDASHPALGGGIGPTFPIIGGADLVDGDADPSADPADPGAEAHGTQMAGLVLGSTALDGLGPADHPRLLVYRVVAREAVGGRVRPLARTDRVLAALESAVDPDGDGDPADTAEVILLGLAAGFEGTGADPLARALEGAERAGALVVAPAGNDGPSFARPGTVGGPAASPAVLAVGGISAARTPRTAHLDARLGPAGARLGPLPLMGAPPPPAGLPVVVPRDDAGVSQGGAPEDLRGPDGVSRVAGALVVLARGEAPVGEIAARAAQAGAAAVALWDEEGTGGFPAIPGDSGMAIPVVGLGPSQGSALVRLAGAAPGMRVRLAEVPARAAAPSVASFSSWGPTIDGRQKPDLVAPAVDRPAPWPGRGPDGGPQTAPLTGTSAAAAEVAAIAVRARIERPELGPRAVRSLMVQAARPLPGVSPARQGAGAAAPPAGGALRIEPAIVASTVREQRLLGRGHPERPRGRRRAVPCPPRRRGGRDAARGRGRGRAGQPRPARADAAGRRRGPARRARGRRHPPGRGSRAAAAAGGGLRRRPRPPGGAGPGRPRRGAGAPRAAASRGRPPAERPGRRRAPVAVARRRRRAPAGGGRRAGRLVARGRVPVHRGAPACHGAGGARRPLPAPRDRHGTGRGRPPARQRALPARLTTARRHPTG